MMSTSHESDHHQREGGAGNVFGDGDQAKDPLIKCTPLSKKET